MHFQHAREIWAEFPGLVPGVLLADGITSDVSVEARVAPYAAVAASRLATVSEGELPEIRAWRQAFARMGLKPTQYRCASESLLRRLRKEGALPRIHPLVDLCNSISAAFAIPVAIFDVARIAGYLEVRHATGGETYATFSGEIEHPAPGEVIFVDGDGHAHARRWTNRQSSHSAVRDSTTTVLIVAEAMHESAPADIARLTSALADEFRDTWAVAAKPTVLSRSSPRFAV